MNNLFPDWLYISLDATMASSAYQSTTTGRFDIVKSMAGQKSFEPAIPSTSPQQRKKRRLYLTDFSLPFETSENCLPLIETLQALIVDGFEIYMYSVQTVWEPIKNTDYTVLSAQLDNLVALLPKEIAEKDPHFCTDTCAVLSYNKLREVASSLSMKLRTSEETVFHSCILPYCQRRGTTLKGHDLPMLYVSDTLLDQIDWLKEQNHFNHNDFYHWGFTYKFDDLTMLNRCMDDDLLPLERIQALHINVDQESMFLENSICSMIEQVAPYIKKLHLGDLSNPNKVISSFPNITQLSVDNCYSNSITPIFEQIETLKSLESLTILTFDSTVEIKKMDLNIKKLSIRYDKEKQAPVLGSILKSCVHLEKIELLHTRRQYNVSNPDDNGFDNSLGEVYFRKLKYVFIANASFSEAFKKRSQQHVEIVYKNHTPTNKNNPSDLSKTFSIKMQSNNMSNKETKKLCINQLTSSKLAEIDVLKENEINELTIRLSEIIPSDKLVEFISKFSKLNHITFDYSAHTSADTAKSLANEMTKLFDFYNGQTKTHPEFTAMVMSLHENMLQFNKEASIGNHNNRIDNNSSSHSIGFEDENFIYDKDNVKLKDKLDANSMNHQQYNMIPRCKILPNGYKFPEIRRHVYRFDFSQTNANSNSASIIPIKPSFTQHLPRTQEKATHEFLYKPIFVKTPKGNYVHKLDSVSRKEVVIRWEISGDTQSYTLHYSDSDNFYYLFANQKPSSNCMIKYLLYAPRPLTEIPHRQILSNKFNQPYKKDDRPNPPHTIQDIIEHPKYYVCGQRVLGCLYYLYKTDKNNAKVFRGVKSGSHAWIETSYGSIDLGGGGEYTLNFVNDQKTSLFEGRKVEEREDKVKIINDTVFTSKIKQHSCNTLLVFKSENDIEIARRFLINHFDTGLMVIDKPADLQTRQDYLEIKGNNVELRGPVGGWVINQLTETNPSKILIDWSQFNARQGAQANACIGPITERNIQGTPINKNVQVIGMILDSSDMLGDVSFISRHFGQVFYCDSSTVPKINAPSSQGEPSRVESINLYHSPRWMDLLMGQVTLVQGKPIHKPAGVQKGTARNFIIYNPPYHDVHFNHIISQLQDGAPIHYFDKSIRLPPLNIQLREGYHFSDDIDYLQEIHLNYVDTDLTDIRIDFTLTPATFDRALQDTYIDANHILQEKEGWVQLNPNETLYIYLPQTLSDEQICALLDHAKAHAKKLVIYSAPNVSFPPQLLSSVPPKNNANYSESQPAPVTTVNQTTITQDDLIIDVSGRSPDDILYGNEQRYHDKIFTFEEKVSDVFLALLEGKNVYLTGKFSPEMVDHLSSLIFSRKIWHQHTWKEITGHLYLCPDGPCPELDWVKNPKTFVNLPFLHNKVATKTRVEEPSEVAAAFYQSRLKAFHTVLIYEEEPAVFIEGEPGCGKSSFMRLLMDNTRSLYQFYSENQLESWATHSDSSRIAILLIDESTSRNTHWSLFEGLYLPFPHLLIGNKIYPIKSYQKVSFIGNTLDEMPNLFTKVATLHFGKLSRDYLIDSILAPILNDHKQASLLYDDNPDRSSRDLHALAVQRKLKDLPTHLSSGNLFSFRVTETRVLLLNQLLASLNARYFKYYAQHSAAQYGGQSGVWIEGPAAVGKTQIMQAVLDDYGYKKDVDYYLLTADMDPAAMLKQIRDAFQKGMLVVIHELDTALNDTFIAELNAYLMGEDLNYQRPEKPGFTLWATGNGRMFSGRRPLPESLRSRMDCITLEQFNKEECRSILQFLFPNIIDSIIDAELMPYVEKHIEHPSQYTFREMIAEIKARTPSCAPRKYENTQKMLNFMRIIPDYHGEDQRLYNKVQHKLLAQIYTRN